jgi:hypothetical protein
MKKVLITALAMLALTACTSTYTKAPLDGTTAKTKTAPRYDRIDLHDRRG